MIAPRGLTWEKLEFDPVLAWKMTMKFKYQSTYFAESRPIYPTETQANHEVALLLDKVEAMNEFPLAKNSLGAFSFLNDAENLTTALANQTGKKASDNFIQSTYSCCC